MAQAKAPAAKPAPAPAQPPQQGTHGPRTALAPTLVDMPASAPNPLKEAADRQRAATDKLQLAGMRKQIEAAGEGSATPPKAQEKSTPQSTPTDSPAGSKDSKPKESAAPVDAATPAGSPPAAPTEPKGPRYDVKSMRKWAEENPEQAAEIRKHVFGADEDSTTEWIRLKNKKRKMVGELTEREQKAMADAQAKLDEAKGIDEKVTKAGTQLAPIADLWGATKESIITKADGSLDYSRVDFDAGDAAFKENSGISIDDYMRARARRGVVSPDMAKLRAENARLKREAESAKPAAKEPEKAPEPEKPAAKTAPAVDWGGEIPKTHKLRQFNGWEADLATEMEQYHDPKLDEYSADPEDVADKLLKRKLAAMAGEEEAPAAPVRARPKIAAKAAPKDDPAPRVRKTPVAELPELGSEADSSGVPKNWAAHERRAIARAQARARGEVVD